MQCVCVYTAQYQSAVCVCVYLGAYPESLHLSVSVLSERVNHRKEDVVSNNLGMVDPGWETVLMDDTSRISTCSGHAQCLTSAGRRDSDKRALSPSHSETRQNTQHY